MKYGWLGVAMGMIMITSLGAAAAQTTETLFGNAAPQTITENDPNAVELGVKFSSAAAGEVTGIRFYKGPKNKGTHKGHLWTAAGMLLASVTFTNESASGWQTANFTTPVQIAAGATYVASYWDPKGYYSVSEPFFTAPYNSGDLNAPVAAGVYHYGSDSFPTLTWNDSNYFVDVNFLRGGTGGGQSITGVTLSNSTFTGGSASGTVVGLINEVLSPTSPAFSGSLSLSGTDAASFQIAGSSLETNGVLPTSTYNINIVATQSSLTGSPFTQPETITGGSASSDPTVGLLPSIRSDYSSWSTAGLQTIGGIPNRTVIYQTISPSGGDDTTIINTALASCPANQVVLLTAGVFKINGNGIQFGTSYCTLRGAGPGDPSLNTGINAVQASPGTYAVDSSATQLIKADRDTNTNYGVLYVLGSGSLSGTSINLASDAVKGATSLTLASSPGSLHAGDIVLVDMNTDNDTDVVYGPSFGPPGDGSRRWFSRQDRTLSQIMEVTGVSGNTVTFDTPFHTTFTVANQAQLTPYSGFLHQIGIENLFIWGGMGGDGHGDIAMQTCAYCWVKNVQATWTIGTSIGFYSTFRSELRDSYIHESAWPNPGGGGYLTGLNTGASDNLFENNIMWSGNKEIVMRGTGGGNVIAYNYMDDSFDNGAAVISSEAGLNAGHYTTPHMELLEGNYSQNYTADSYWGNSIYITVFRNWLSGLRAAHPPLDSYITTQVTGGGFTCHYKYGDYSNRFAADVQAYSYNHSFVGNVLGMNGQTLLVNPYQSESCFNGNQTGFVEQIWLNSQGSTGGSDPVWMWTMGSYQATVNTTGNWSWVDTTLDTQLRQGNWDWVTAAQHWYGIGGTTDGAGGSPVTIPNSFYLMAKPSFFGSQPWPWVDPTTGTTYTLPAKYCFEHSMMPTCLQGS